MAGNVLWNLLGTGAPLLVALVAIPILISGLGTARFGVLTLAWMLVGYFSLFDLGLGRALTKLIAEKLGKGRDDEIPALVWTAISMMTVLGIIGAVILGALSPWMVADLLNIPLELQAETLKSFRLLATALPIVSGAAGLRGVLEANQQFGRVNSVRIPLGVFTFLGPVLVLLYSNSLVAVVAVLVVARLVSWCAYGVLCLYVVPSLRHSVTVRRTLVGPLLRFGGWMTVTNIVGPLMVYMDRFLIGAMVSMVSVAHYATPYEIVTKMWIVPAALMGVMFPAFSTNLASDPERAGRLFRQTVKYIFLSLFPLVIIVVTFGDEALTLWLGGEFASQSSLVLQLLAVGVFVNSHAHVPSGLVQGAGHPDWTAKLHLIELPFYLTLLWLLLQEFGIVGVAIAWVTRAAIDAVVLFAMADKVLPSVSPGSMRPILVASVSILLCVAGATISGLFAKGVFVFLVLTGFTVIAWFLMLSQYERELIQGHLKTTRSPIDRG